MFSRVDEPTCGVVRETNEDAAGGSLKLLFVCDELIVEFWFKAFEECWTAKDTEVGEAGFPVVREFKGVDGNAVRVCSVLSGTGINNVNSIGVSLMKGGSTKACCVE